MTQWNALAHVSLIPHFAWVVCVGNITRKMHHDLIAQPRLQYRSLKFVWIVYALYEVFFSFVRLLAADLQTSIAKVRVVVKLFRCVHEIKDWRQRYAGYFLASLLELSIGETTL